MSVDYLALAVIRRYGDWSEPLPESFGVFVDGVECVVWCPCTVEPLRDLLENKGNMISTTDSINGIC